MVANLSPAVFHINMEDFRKNTCFMVENHATQTPDTITYFSVFTIETAHIIFTMVVLHDLKVKAADFLNAYLMALDKEKT